VASDKPAAQPVPNPTTHPIRPFGRHVIGRKLNSNRRRAGTANQDIPPANVENPRTTCAAHTRESRRRGRRDKSDYIRVLQAALRDAGYLDHDSSIDPTALDALTGPAAGRVAAARRLLAVLTDA